MSWIRLVRYEKASPLNPLVSPIDAQWIHDHDANSDPAYLMHGLKMNALCLENSESTKLYIQGALTLNFTPCVLCQDHCSLVTHNTKESDLA